jgi:hypothetical protein
MRDVEHTGCHSGDRSGSSAGEVTSLEDRAVGSDDVELFGVAGQGCCGVEAAGRKTILDGVALVGDRRNVGIAACVERKGNRGAGYCGFDSDRAV